MLGDYRTEFILTSIFRGLEVVRMRVYLWVFIITVFLGSDLSSFGDEIVAQRSPILPTSISGEYIVSEEDSSVCLDYETRTSTNTCEPDFKVGTQTIIIPNSSSPTDTAFDENDEQISLLPNPDVDFIEDYMVKFDNQKSRDTIFFGGVVPFVAIPDGEFSTEDSFFNEESFSVFLYLKRKF